MKQVDLHVHTSYSDDADHTPQEIINKAKAKGLACIAITDHNTTAAIEEAIKLGSRSDMEIVPGIELDTNFQEKNLHILGYYLNWRSPEIDELLGGLKAAQQEQFQKRIDKLQELGFQITAEEVLAEAEGLSHPPGGLIAEVLLSKAGKQPDKRLKPYLTGNKSNQPYFNFYLDYFKQGGKAYVPCWKPSSQRAIEVIDNLGGVPVLAHPGATLGQEDKKLISELSALGLKGIEAYSTYHQQREVEFFKQIAAENDLLITAGSDFHGKLKPEIELGEIEGNNYAVVEKLKKMAADSNLPGN